MTRRGHHQCNSCQGYGEKLARSPSRHRREIAYKSRSQRSSVLTTFSHSILPPTARQHYSIFISSAALSYSNSAMLRSSTFFGFCLAAVNSAFAVSAHGGLSRTTLNIVNKAISPDGYSRDSVLANGTHPGPLISGYKVRHHAHRVLS